MCQSCRVPLCPVPVWPVGTGLHGTQSPLQPQKHSVFNNWVLCKTLYGLWVQVFVVLNLLCNHKNSVFKNWVLCKTLYDLWVQVFTVLNFFCNHNKKNPVFLTTGCPLECLCVRTLYGLWIHVFIVLQFPLQPQKRVFLTTGCHAKPCMTLYDGTSWFLCNHQNMCF